MNGELDVVMIVFLVEEVSGLMMLLLFSYLLCVLVFCFGQWIICDFIVFEVLVEYFFFIYNEDFVLSCQLMILFSQYDVKLWIVVCSG